MTTDTTEGLKPCPFCGSGAVKWRATGKKPYIAAACISEACPASTWNLPIKTWNTRLPDRNLPHAPDKSESENTIHNMQQALRHFAKLYWPHNAAVTDDIEALRRACREHCDWWNNIALPLLDDADCPTCGEDHEGNVPFACETGDGLC